MDTKSDLESAVDFIEQELQKEGIVSNTDEDSEETAIKKLTEKTPAKKLKEYRAPMDHGSGELGEEEPGAGDYYDSTSDKVGSVINWLNAADDVVVEEIFDLFVGEDPSNKLGMLQDIAKAGPDRVEMLYDIIQEYEGLTESKKLTKDSK